MLMRRVHAENTSSSAVETANLLSESGLIAYQKAVKEQLPLAHIAEQTERPQYWFANNILQIVGVYGLPSGKKDFVRLERKQTGALKLIDDMTALTGPDGPERCYEDLRVTKADFDRYLEWARTVY